MRIEFDESFFTSLKKLKNPTIHPKIIKIIQQAERAKSIQELTGVKKLKGYANYYRIRKGDYRLGLELIPI
jgi:mRNA interferase RelE/StbE